jgi:FAD/FMN-containing dehydrogenase
MATVYGETIAGERTSLDDEAIGRFNERMRGEVLTPEHPDYDDVRKLWNGMHDKRPALIARCTGTADIVASVNFAREEGLLLAVRGGGHNVAGNASVDGGLMIDLSLMRGVHIDPARRTARVGPGARWGDFDREAQLFGLATTGGEVSTTGIAGFTLGGGMGTLQRKYGLACDNLISAQVVTASGDVITASESDHPDLFWAIRGGGGNFGVVSSFEYQLHPVGPELYAATVIYPHADGPNLLRKWHEFTKTAPDEVTTQVLIWSMPPLPDVPEEMHGDPILTFVGVYSGPVHEGEVALRPLRELGDPIADLSGPAPYVQIQSDFDPFFPDGDLYYWKSLFVDDLSEVISEVMLRQAIEVRPNEAALVVRQLGGAVARVPESATAFGNRSAGFNVSYDALWQDPTHSEENIAWVRSSWTELQQMTGGGVYLNFAGFGEDVAALAKAGHQSNLDRLREVKRLYDPMNLFRSNINIRP